jgi:outer membrane murein-binding lipoprotein Lpp
MDTSGIRSLLLFLALGGGLAYYWDRNQRAEKFEAVQSEVTSITGTIAQRQSEIAFLEKKLGPLREAQKEAIAKDVPKLQAEVAALKQELDALKVEWESAITDFETAMTEVRLTAKQTTYPELVLPSGEVLKAASISKFGQGFVTIQYDGGVKKVLSEDLPAGWNEKYSLDYVPDTGREELAGQIQESTALPSNPAGTVDAALAKTEAIYEQELRLSQEIREMKMESNRIVQEGFRAAINRGLSGDAAAAARRSYFQKADAIRKAIDPKVEQYRKLRQQRLVIQQEQVQKANAAKPRQN